VVLALAVALGQERLVPGRLLGVLASVAGVAVIALGSLRQAGPAGADAWRGDLLLVGAVASWGAYLTVNKPLVARHGSLPTLAGTFLVGSLLQLPIAAASWPWGTALSAASPVAWRAVAHLMLVVSIVGLSCQNRALRRFDASHVAAVGNMAPLLTVCWGIWLLHEPMTPWLALGGLLTLGGIVCAGRPGRPKVATGAGDGGWTGRSGDRDAPADVGRPGECSPTSRPAGSTLIRREVCDGPGAGLAVT
jgi:drug/metabolite transporter (DMT)-like permease